MHKRPMLYVVVSFVLLSFFFFERKEIQGIFIKGSVHQSDHLEFSWETYSNPENPEFWDDGDGMPPRPFRYVAAYPTKENARKLKEWIQKQTEVMAKVTAVLATVNLTPDFKGKEMLAAVNLNPDFKENNFLKLKKVDWKKIEIVYLYQTTCKACQKGKKNIEKLISMGATVHPLQVDYKTESPLFRYSIPYKEELKKDFPLKVTPTLWLKNKGTYIKIEGHIDLVELEKMILKENGRES